MQFRVARALLALMLTAALGGHWFLLQSVAWVGMFAKYTKTDSVGAALVKTFDGKHPCQLCRVVEEGKNSEDKPAASVVKIKLDNYILDRSPLTALPTIETSFAVFGFTETPNVRSEPPPIPPPRAV